MLWVNIKNMANMEIHEVGTFSWVFWAASVFMQMLLYANKSNKRIRILIKWIIITL